VHGSCCGAGALLPPLREPLVSLLDFERQCCKWYDTLHSAGPCALELKIWDRFMVYVLIAPRSTAAFCFCLDVGAAAQDGVGYDRLSLSSEDLVTSPSRAVSNRAVRKAQPSPGEGAPHTFSGRS
jgi:hypothetical protein